jgi:hypothetical protein
MKAKELMIDGLFRVKKDVCLPKGTIVVIRGIDADKRFPKRNLVGSSTCLPVNSSDGFTYGVWAEYLEPIPLTPEVLEKNFESKSNVFGLQTYKLSRDFYLENRGDRFCLLKKCNVYNHSTFWICDLAYLHQLRLYGIEKEIKL